ncbi:ATP-dependent DNA helicase DinG [Erwinia psidii]|uniref:ATP-dependent DNA helicase DinG n=1 Tax=Erwinia psidii TaxID=69224 RepID=A0A3N6UZN7_9GAMM|nr:ATP-dependent DNA helicase DinG [Erwinia psidii]MCX8957307.1 ATP-dependent DNA helicase DinG [Erwinia psidii]MCX8959677.1 ATP-dependent DNA helicase DinG [Erwinia psidii]RQM38265.1 ATP-dependent DNA helicase DinG [Erwinia psidii]
MALNTALRAQITGWYKALQQQIPDFIPRAPQRQMIAEVAKTLAGDDGRHLAIEAPTGVGKTLSYLIPGIAISRAQEKPLVVSTANVALQDQIYSKDLPLLKKIIPDLRFTAAFGRGRYVCPRNLSALATDEEKQGDLLLFYDDAMTASKDERERCTRLESDLKRYQWDGLRDHCEESIEDSLWQRLSTDKANCLGSNCHWFRECPFFVARREIEHADVVVANHALVMAALETESVLPPPKNLLLVVDEGHHLPDVARDALEMNGDITPDWCGVQLDLFCRLVEQCMAQFRPKRPPPLAQSARLTAHCEDVREQLRQLSQILTQWLPSGNEEGEYRFEMGRLPEEVQLLCARLFRLCDALRGLAEALVNDLSDKTGQFDVVRLHRTLLQMNRALGWFEASSRLWRLAEMEQASGAPVSKWVTRNSREGTAHLMFHCAGIRVSEQLEKLLWRKIPHVVLTSATLRSLRSFQRLQEMSGLSEKEGDRFVALDSPFNHLAQGKLIIPQMRHEPSLASESSHLAEMANFFRQQMKANMHKGILVLFASGRAMQQFIAYLPDQRLIMLVQGDKPRPALIALHRKKVEQGKTSVLVGLQSFAEGLDLKGELLSQVHIHKIAFPPVDSPVILTEGEWLKSLKRYPFEVQSLPSASFNLIQQVGRLIRSHECFGEIVIYDRRLLSKSYGARLLEALPVFPIEQPPLPEGELPTASVAGSGKKASPRRRR